MSKRPIINTFTTTTVTNTYTMRTHTYVYIHAYIHVYIHTHTCIQIYTRTYIHTYVHMVCLMISVGDTVTVPPAGGDLYIQAHASYDHYCHYDHRLERAFPKHHDRISYPSLYITHIHRTYSYTV